MTVPSTTRKAGPYTGNGVQTVFPFSFKVFSVADVTVTQTDTIGVDTTLTSGYVVTLNPDQVASPGGSITLSVAPPSGYKITATGALPYDQTLSLPGGGNFSPVAAENAFDRVVMQLQQVNEKVSRAITLPVSSTQAPSDYLTLVNSASASAAASASQAATSAAGAGVSATSASISASASATSAAQAVVAKDAAIAAWAASTAPSEQLASISTSIHFGAVVKSIVYDTSKDSDGGAWRKRCQGKSWANENQDTFWIGQRASAAAAWAIAGNGAYFQNTTDGKFYRLNGTSPNVIEVFRGGSTEFPAQVAIVAEAARVVIYDLTQSSCPMWMVFKAGNFSYTTGSIVLSNTISSVTALNGHIVFGETNATDGRVCQVNFISEIAQPRSAAGSTCVPYLGNISQRNSGLGFGGNAVAPIVNRVVNDVAITVLDTAPIDPATGLPVPTIAVACGSAGVGGVSIIRDDGTVVNAITANGAMDACSFGRGAELWVSGGTGVLFKNWFFANVLTGTPSYLFDEVTIPARRGTNGSSGRVTKNVKWGSDVAFAINSGNSTVEGISRIKQNTASFPLSLLANITNAYNSGWLPGDIRGAYLADTTAETITASGELVTNGTFTTDTSGWTPIATASLSVVSNRLRLTAATGSDQARQTITTVVGKTYVATVDIQASTGASYANIAGVGTALANTTRTEVITFTASSTSSLVALVSNVAGTVDFDNISVKLAEPDRSVKNTGMVVNGSLTKTAVATGAGLVAYSGFSASNYLEQPYSANLDFGTGDFCVMGWVNPTSFAAASSFLHRSVSGSTGGLLLQASTTGALELYGTASSTYTLIVASAASAIPLNQHSLIAAVRVSGTVFLYVNGVQVATVANSTNLTYASALTRIGVRLDSTTYVFGSMALWRISATAPSADQIAHIYRTELPLFQAGAQCTIAGTSTAVTALAYDDVADTLHVGTSWGRSGFRDLLRVDSETATTGAITSLSANEGVVITGGASSAKAYAPAMYLRDELRRKDVARKALGRIPAFFDYTATASQTAFVAPKGFTIKALYKNGTLMRETTTGVYWTRSNDGFQETATLSVGASVSDWISLMCVKV